MRINFFLRLFCVLLTLDSYGQAKRTYKIPEVTIVSDYLVKGINEYAQEFKDDLVLGTMIVRYDKENSDHFYISYVMYKDEVVDRPPSFYAVIHGNLVLFYTGIEPYLKYDSSSFKQMFSHKSSHLRGLPMTILYDPIIWKLKRLDSDFEKIVVAEFLW